MVILGIALSILGASFLLFLILFFVNPDRAKDFLGSLAAWVRSLAESSRVSKGKHKRRTDPPDAPAHEHKRRTTPHPTGFMTIRAFAVPPKRREADTLEEQEP